MNTYINTKTLPERLGSQRGAMFGLDARLALAIFAGLSVIAGMAVFDTIRRTDVTALVSEFDNISKGYTNYNFDTGIDIPEGSNEGQGFNGLFEPTTDTPSIQPLGWNGPYITRSTADHPKFGDYDIVRGDIDTKLNDPTTGSSGIEGAWLSLTAVPCEVIKDVDEAVDGEGPAQQTPPDPSDPKSADSGNVRFPSTCDEGETKKLYYLLSRTM